MSDSKNIKQKVHIWFEFSDIPKEIQDAAALRQKETRVGNLLIRHTKKDDQILDISF